MATDTQTPEFAEQLKKAANEFPQNSCAFAQFCDGGRFTKIRLQAPEIMVQFVGKVEFGRDPKGILFFRTQDDLTNTAQRVYYKIFYHTEKSTWKTVQVDFYELPSQKNIARFLARVDQSKYRLPSTTALPGLGRWRVLKASTSQVDIHQMTGDRELSLKHPSISKEGYFQVEDKDEFKQAVKTTGVMIFSDIKLLTPTTKCVANYSSDRIVFHPPGKPGVVIALCIPREPITTIGEGIDEGKWEDYEPDASESAFPALGTGGVSPREAVLADDVEKDT